MLIVDRAANNWRDATLVFSACRTRGDVVVLNNTRFARSDGAPVLSQSRTYSFSVRNPAKNIWESLASGAARFKSGT